MIGQTIGEAVAGGISQAAERRQRVSNNVAAIRDFALDGQEGLPTEAQIAQLAEIERSLNRAARRPGDADARRRADDAIGDFLEANRDLRQVKGYLERVDGQVAVSPNGGADRVTVEGRRDYWAGRYIDGSGIWVGEQAQHFEAAAASFIASTPGAGLALSIADAGLTIAGGPVRYAGGQLLEAFKGEVEGWFSGQLEGENKWSFEKADSGGKGFVLAGGILLSGAGGLLRRTGGVAEGVTARASRLGREGETAAGTVGRKTGIMVTDVGASPTKYRLARSKKLRMSAGKGGQNSLRTTPPMRSLKARRLSCG